MEGNKIEGMDDRSVEYREKIETEFPEIEYQNSKIITHGWDNDVVILDDSVVFRFPKTDEYKERFKTELNLLSYLAPKISIAVPDYKYLPEDKTFGGYPIIPGVEMRPDLLNKFSDEHQEHIAKGLGTFLTTLHATPKESIEEIGIDTKTDYYFNPKQIRDVYEGIKTDLYPDLAPEEIKWIEYKFDKYFSLSLDVDLTLTHRDLAGDHIFVDPETQELSGIIDFADAEFADPALDFGGLFDYGEGFVEKVLESYKGPTDKDFLARAKFRRLAGMIPNMLKIKRGGKLPVSFENQRNQLNKRMKLFPVTD